MSALPSTTTPTGVLFRAARALRAENRTLTRQLDEADATIEGLHAEVLALRATSRIRPDDALPLLDALVRAWVNYSDETRGCDPDTHHFVDFPALEAAVGAACERLGYRPPAALAVRG